MSSAMANPHRVPLKRRYADHRYKDMHRKDKRFLYGVQAVDKWKDIPSVLVIRLYWEYIIIPGGAQSIAAPPSLQALSASGPTPPGATSSSNNTLPGNSLSTAMSVQGNTMQASMS